MKRTRWRLLVACLAVTGAAIAVAGVNAGNRTAERGVTTIPIESATDLENLAYTFTLKNTGKSTFTQVEVRQTIPVATLGTTTYPAVLEDASCDWFQSGNEIICNLGKLNPGATVPVTFVWQVPAIPSPTGCTDCVTVEKARFFIKEGKPTNTNEEFVVPVEPRSLLGNEGTDEKLRAASYEIEACSDPGGEGSLRTNRQVTSTDPVSTTICIPSVTPFQAFLGYLTEITEFAGNAHRSDVCIADLGEDCVVPYVAADFGPDEVVTYVIRVLLPANQSITQVRHNGELITADTCSRAVSPECVEIIPPKGSPKIWTIIATSETNGPFTW